MSRVWTMALATGSLLIAGCGLKPTPEGTTFCDWKGPGETTKRLTKRYSLRGEFGTAVDIDLHFGGNEEQLTSLRCVLVKNRNDWTMLNEVSTSNAKYAPQRAYVMVAALKTGSMGSHGNKYGTSGVIEVRQGFVLTAAYGKSIEACADSEPKGTDGTLCER